jgi:hypothetical protein
MVPTEDRESAGAVPFLCVRCLNEREGREFWVEVDGKCYCDLCADDLGHEKQQRRDTGGSEVGDAAE